MPLFLLCAARVDHRKHVSKIFSRLVSFFFVKKMCVIVAAFCDVRYLTGVGNPTLNCRISPRVGRVGN